MTGLRELLIEAADDARAYDVTDRTVRMVKRRRAMMRLVPVAAALLVATGLLGWAMNAAFTRVERRVLHWHPSQRAAVA